MSNKEKFLKLVSGQDTQTLPEIKDRIKNRAMLRESQHIAIKVLARLDELGWNQKDLAASLSVSEQQVSKIVSGKENMTIETQIKLQNALDIPVLASYYETKIENLSEMVITLEKRIENIAIQAYLRSTDYQSARTIKLEIRHLSQENYHSKAI